MLESESGADRVPLVECTSAARKRLANFREGVEQGMISQSTTGHVAGGSSSEA